MKPKEKAKDLFNKFYLHIDIKNYENTKQCALIAVDEVLDSIDWDYYEGSRQTEQMYWKEVKQEIEKL